MYLGVRQFFHILTLQSPWGHPCRIVTFLVYTVNKSSFRTVSEETRKRTVGREPKLPRKRPKLVPIPKPAEPSSRPANQKPAYSAKEVFEQIESSAQKKIQLRLPEAVSVTVASTGVYHLMCI